MTPSLCSLLLWLLSATPDGYVRVDSFGDFAASIHEGIDSGLLESMQDVTGVALDLYWVRLSERGREVAQEGKCAMEGAA
jgi:hypothetical protein